MTTNNKTNKNDEVDLVKLGLTTTHDIVQMARYRTQYVLEKESHNNNQTSVSNQNRDKMIYYTCRSAIGVLGFIAIGIVGLIESKRTSGKYDFDLDD